MPLYSSVETTLEIGLVGQKGSVLAFTESVFRDCNIDKLEADEGRECS